MNSDNFQFPPIYSLPPFFTLQPIVDTKKKQIELWCNLVLDYIRHYKLSELFIQESQLSPLFYNKEKNRRLDMETIKIIFDALVTKGNAEWQTLEKQSIYVYWKSPSEWSEIIYKYVVKTAKTNVVLTLYELRESDDVENQEFYELDLPIFNKALDILVSQNKAVVFKHDENVGIKFF